jgi:hypothetical protein
LRAYILVLLTLFIANGVSIAEIDIDSIYSFNKSMTLAVDQSIQGDGYYMNYQYIKMPNALEGPVDDYGVETKNYALGTGSADLKSSLSAKSTNRIFGAVYDAELMDYEMATSSIQIKEDNKVVYNPTTMNIGSGFYVSNPITFDSLLKEKNWIKNRGGGNFMENQIDYAHAFDKKLDSMVYIFEDEDDPAITRMNIFENMTNGKAHIGVIQADPDAIAIPETEIDPDTEELETIPLAKSAWRNPKIYVDEDYFGTMQIDKRMNITTYLNEDDQSDDYNWLPCSCQSGWIDMDLHDQRYHGAAGIFDCTCSNALSKLM